MKYLTILAMLGLFLASCGDDTDRTPAVEIINKLPAQFGCADGTVYSEQTEQCEALK